MTVLRLTVVPGTAPIYWHSALDPATGRMFREYDESFVECRAKFNASLGIAPVLKSPAPIAEAA